MTMVCGLSWHKLGTSALVTGDGYQYCRLKSGNLNNAAVGHWPVETGVLPACLHELKISAALIYETSEGIYSLSTSFDNAVGMIIRVSPLTGWSAHGPEGI